MLIYSTFRRLDNTMLKLKNPELIQSFIRLCIGGLTYVYITTGIESEYFIASQNTIFYFSLFFFGLSIVNILSILWIPSSTPRRYAMLAFDIGVTTFASFLSGGLNSVYILVYLWIYIGYGSRYGINFLSVAVALTLLSYNVLLLTEDAWHLLSLEAIAFLLIITALPAYLYSMQKRLMKMATQADSKNIAKNEFLHTMAQQVNSPMGGIVGMTDLLNKTELNIQQKQYLQSLSQSSQSLQEIIEDIVDFSRLEKADIPLNHVQINPRILIDGLVHSLAPLGYEKSRELTYYINSSFPNEAYIDAQKFRQLLSNLIRYAIQHSASKSIYIHAYAGTINANENLNANIEIQFQQSTETEPLQPNKMPNTNETLPLRISYQLTRLMNGLFEIQTNENQDVIFNLHFNWEKTRVNYKLNKRIHNNKRILIFDIDKVNLNVLEKYCLQLDMEVYTTSGHDNLIAHILWSQEKAQLFDIIILCEDIKHKHYHDLVNRIRNETLCNAPILYATYMHRIEQIAGKNLEGIQATILKPISLDILTRTLADLLLTCPPKLKTPENTLPTLNILIAEDYETNASDAYEHLTNLGHNVDIATDGNTALYAMNKYTYHLVLMDTSMPSLDGIEATKYWRFLERGVKRTPIFALMESATDQTRDLCISAGMDDFFSKPINELQLKDALSKHFTQIDGTVAHNAP